MSQQWDALVLNDYESVMPLTWNKKFGIRYLYQPFLTAQLGVFGNAITEKITGLFIEKARSSFNYIDISLNSNNILPSSTNFSIQRSNYVLDMNKPYELLYQNYRENIQRNIKKAFQSGCTVQKGFDIEKVIKLAIQQMKGYGKEETKNIQHFRKLYRYLHTRQMATTYGINSAKGDLLASCVFFFSHNKAYYILVGNHPDGKTIGASHALIDAFIKDYTGKNLFLDFEGSDISSLAFFYSSFGATHETYPAIKINQLPFFLKWLKR